MARKCSSSRSSCRCCTFLERECHARNIHTHILTGQTKDRQSVVTDFQKRNRRVRVPVEPARGGTGLNLTNASYVVLYDPWWNPAVEAQAIDRSHRIGQTQTVNAYRLIAPGTVEEKIWELQQSKAQDHCRRARRGRFRPQPHGGGFGISVRGGLATTQNVPCHNSVVKLMFSHEFS